MIAVALAALPMAVRAAEPVQLKFGYPSPPTSWTNTMGATPWIKQVEEAAGGTVEIKLFPGGAIANFRTVYDRLLNGVIDVCFGTFGEIGDQYPRTSVWSLPFEAERSSQSGAAVWRLLESGIIAEEYAKVKPLVVFGFGTQGIHARQPARRLEDVQGLKIIALSRSSGDAMTRSGAAPVTMTPAEIYQALERGLAAGVSFTWPGVDTFKIGEVTRYHVDLPVGMGGGYFFMNKDSYARLPDKAREAVDKFSGRPLSQMLAKAVDQQDEEAVSRVMAMPDQVRHRLAPDEAARWKARLAPMTDEWVKNVPDGAKILAAYRAEVAKIKGGM
jgi:TRAP-type C4-dicarboxylate transport system substrate-binding protein